MIRGRSHRRHLWVPAVAAISMLVLPGRGSLAAAAQPKAAGGTCSPSGTKLSITSFDSKFDKKCLAAPANQAFTIDFTNLDRGIPHNVAIYQDDTALMRRAAQYLESYSLPFLARFLTFEDKMREEVDQGGEGDQGLLV